MSTAVLQTWPSEFGLSDRRPPEFFRDESDVRSASPQSHLLKRAFGTLEVDGVLCANSGAPLAYFKVCEQFDADAGRRLQRQFWNHGGASVLVVVTDASVLVYSGLVRPDKSNVDEPASLVETLERTVQVLTEFVTSVETGAYFFRHKKSFDPRQRVDNDLLANLTKTRQRLAEAGDHAIVGVALDALLCRLVFASYLFDREVIGRKYVESKLLPSATTLSELLSHGSPEAAKQSLYTLFSELREDFNGDLFSDDLTGESELVNDEQISIIRQFFAATDVETGQLSFWAYDFSIIPIETISAIYERFLKEDKRADGAFYTPRFLAEVVVDVAFEGRSELLGGRYLDPSCGSGIFLVAIFNRLAAEWNEKHPKSRNPRRARELMNVLRASIFGVDKNPTACRIAAFSLYLAYLDQLTPPDIQSLQAKGQALPRLISGESVGAANIWCSDAFECEEIDDAQFDVVVGNPPWGSLASAGSPAAEWCLENGIELPDKQIASAFMWKAAEQVVPSGNVCLVLPHGVLFNHSGKATSFQERWLSAHHVDLVVNLADLRRLLFDTAVHPALIIRYSAQDSLEQEYIDYWSPKASWQQTQAEVISVQESDRSKVDVHRLLRELRSKASPKIWKRFFWATQRDRRFLDRLDSLPALGELVAKGREKSGSKRWQMAVGFQPCTNERDESNAKDVTFSSRSFVEATSSGIDLFLLQSDCDKLPSNTMQVRRFPHQKASVFEAPHVLVTKGFQRIAFADFDVSFQDAVRGISGPPDDSSSLAFLAAYLRSPVARYYQFHSSSNWGVYRPEIHVEELLRTPFFLPGADLDGSRRAAIVEEVASLVDTAKTKASESYPFSREIAVDEADRKILPLLYEYFDVLPKEQQLIEDTLSVLAPSVQPTRGGMPVPTIVQANQADLAVYSNTLTSQLCQWLRTSSGPPACQVVDSAVSGLAIARVCLAERASDNLADEADSTPVLQLLSRIRSLAAQSESSIDIYREVMVFEDRCVYIVKPLGRRFWTSTAALNDADAIAGSVLMDQRGRE